MYNDDEHESVKPVFLKGCGIIIAIIVILVAGFLFTLGILSVINKVSPTDLLKGINNNAAQSAAPEKPGESGVTKNEKPDLEEKKDSASISLQAFNDSIAKLVDILEKISKSANDGNEIKKVKFSVVDTGKEISRFVKTLFDKK